jgi:ABC-type uncharacterized transport system substrate-binding protein
MKKNSGLTAQRSALWWGHAMKTLIYLLLLIATVIVGAVVHAQQPKKIVRLGYLSDSNPVRESARADAIRLALREFGYIEGQNTTTEYRYAEGKVDRAPQLAAELVQLNVDIIIVAGGPIQIRAAKNATKTIPIVMTGDGADPVEALLGSGSTAAQESFSNRIPRSKLSFRRETVGPSISGGTPRARLD